MNFMSNSHVLHRIAARRSALTIVIAMLCLMSAGGARARSFTMEPLPPDAVAAMSVEARTLYEKGLAQLDRINYDAALDYFKKAVDKAGDNMDLRFMVVRLARYRGDSTFGAAAVKNNEKSSESYYDIAAENLRAMSVSTKLNARERERAAKSLQDVLALRATIAERDEQRIAFGRLLDKGYMDAAAGKTSDTDPAKSKDALRGKVAPGKNQPAGRKPALRGDVPPNALAVPEGKPGLSIPPSPTPVPVTISPVGVNAPTPSVVNAPAGANLLPVSPAGGSSSSTPASSAPSSSVPIPTPSGSSAPASSAAPAAGATPAK